MRIREAKSADVPRLVELIVDLGHPITEADVRSNLEILAADDMTELERRLRTRGTDSEDVIQDRMSRAASEISHWPEYEYVLVNRDTDDCLRQVQAIVAAERLKKSRQTDLVPFTRSLGVAH